jgi:hypothetical protein
MVLHELLAHSLGDLAVVLFVNDGVDRHAGIRSRKDQLEHVAKARHRRKRTTAQGEGMTFSSATAEVARRQDDGSWRYVIDDPFGSGTERPWLTRYGPRRAI